MRTQANQNSSPPPFVLRRWLWLLPAIGPLLVGAWVALLLWELPYFGLDAFDDPVRAPQGGPVTHLAQVGPAAQAGIGVGDYLLVEDRFPFRYSPPSPFLLPEQLAAPAFATVRAGGEPSRAVLLSPTTPPVEIIISRYEALAIGLVFWAVGLVLLILRPHHTASRLFYILGQLVAVMLIVGSASAVYYPAAWVPFRIFLIFAAAVALHFCATFPTPLKARARKPILAATYAIAAFLTLVTVVLPAFSVSLLSFANLTLIYRIYILVVLLYALALLLSKRHRIGDLALYKQRLLIMGMIVSFLPVLALSFLPELLTGAPLLDYIWTFPALVLLPISYAYAVSQQGLGRVDHLMNRSLVYGLLTILLLVGYFSLSLVLGWLIPAENWSRPLASSLLAVSSVLLYSRVRVRLQRWIDRIFLGGWYDYHSVTRAASARLSQASNLEQLLSQLTSIVRSMRFRSALLFLPEADRFVPKGEPDHLLPEGLDTSGTSGAPGAAPAFPALPTSSYLVRYLRDQDRPLHRSILRQELEKRPSALTEAEQVLIGMEDLEYWLPLVSRGELRGLLALGKRQTEIMLSAEDIDIMMLLAAQAAVAAENVGLVEALRARLAEMEQIRSDLTEAQRRLAENQEVGRIRLAQELHDGAVQQLLGISYQLVKGPSYNGAIAPGSNGNGHGYSAGDGYGHPALRDPQSPDDEYDTAGFALHLPPFPISQFDPQSGCPPGDRNPGAWKATEIDLDSIRHEMLSVVTQLRGLIGELRPPGLDEFGVVTAIEGYVSKLRRDAQTGSRPMPDVFLDLPAENTDLPRPVALCLFRTTQEAVRNALKHANSTCIDVHLRVEPDGVVLSVVDDGDGFKVPTNFSKLAQDDHYGLIGMAERVEWVNGRLTIDSQSGHGTELTVWIPLPN